MVHKLGTLADLEKLPSMDANIRNLIELDLSILDVSYGSDRNIDNDDGGYVLFAEPGTKDIEVLSWFDYEQYIPEYIDYLDTAPQYVCRLYLLSHDYGIVLLTAVADTPKEVLDEIHS